MKFLNHLQFNENEAKNMKMFRVANPTTTYTNAGVSGNIIMDTTAAIPKWWDGTAWRDFSYGTTGTMNWTIQSDNAANIQVNNGETLDLTGGQAMVTTTSGTGTAPVVTFDVQNYGVMNATTTAATAGDATTNIYGVERHPTTDKLQVHVPWTNTQNTYIAGVGLTLNTATFDANTWGANSAASAAADTTDTSAKWYGVMTDSNDKLVVRVPWTDTTTNTQATYTLPVAAGGANTAVVTLTGGGTASGTNETLTFAGTTNEVAVTETTGNNGTITIGLPDDVTIGNDLTVTNNALVSGGLTVTGNLTVNGTTTTVNTTDLEVEDNIIRINKVDANASSANTVNAGIEVERGSSTNVSLKWIESSDTWVLEESTTNLNLGGLVSKKVIQEIWKGVSADSGTAAHVANTTNNTLNIIGANGVSTSATGQTVTVSGGTGNTPSAVATISSTSINASTNKLATITHSLGTKDIIVRLYEIDGDNNDEIYADVTAISTSACTVKFSANLSVGVNVRAVIIAAKYAGSVTPTYS
jgi:hypothetical protein